MLLRGYLEGHGQHSLERARFARRSQLAHNGERAGTIKTITDDTDPEAPRLTEWRIWPIVFSFQYE
jgi:hypothetical protein